jgi:streptogramin lyase
VYISEQFGGGISEVDLDTGEYKHYVAPGPIPEQAPLGLRIAHGPHSLAEGHDDKFYYTDTAGNSIGEFDPKTKQFQHDPAGDGAIYPHTVRVDRKGIVWACATSSGSA